MPSGPMSVLDSPSRAAIRYTDHGWHLAMSELNSLRLMLNDLERSMATQVAKARHMDDKASGIVRFNTVFLGLLVAGASMLEVGPRLSQWAGIVLLGGVGFLLASTLLAVHSYRVTEYRFGLDSDRLRDAARVRPDEASYLVAAIEGYGAGVAANRGSLDRVGRLLDGALAGVVPGVFLAAAGLLGLVGGGP